MKTAVRIFALSLAIFTTSSGVNADDKDKAAPKADPPSTPLEITLEGKTEYKLDLGDKTGAEFRKLIKELTDPDKPQIGFGNTLPNPPEVDMKLVIKNTGKQAVQVWNTGDPVVLLLKLSGEGTLNVSPMVAMTLEFRLPKPVQIEPGKTFEMPIKSLKSGMRGITHHAYWTEKGTCELTAELQTGVFPQPKGAEDYDGFGRVTLTSAPVKVTVK